MSTEQIDRFFRDPILNSPYESPLRHWQLDESGQPTHQIVETRRPAKLISPIPRARKRVAGNEQQAIRFDDGVSSSDQAYTEAFINDVRGHVNRWRAVVNPNHWGVTPETTRLLQHWRHHSFSSLRPFFCQIEAVETAIWLTEVAPHSSPAKGILEHLARANQEANPDLPMRLALKLATGAGKTTVMAMLIAWQTVNASRGSKSKLFTNGFLICTPGITIKDRLRVLMPEDPESYYKSRELVPNDMLDAVKSAKIVITNYHAFGLRERVELAAGTRALLKGRLGDDLHTEETAGQMIQRVMSPLMGMKNIMVMNDEAHHCYREKPHDASEEEDEELKGDERKEAEKNREAARMWISGLEAVHEKLGISRVIDLSATPFFLAGSGYAEGSLFPWTMSDFSLMDAIECGIVKLPRVPVAENIPGGELPMFRNLWENIRKDMPKKGRGQGEELDPGKLPTRLKTAISALYGHYEKTYNAWESAGIDVPPCFIIVCQNTAISKLVYDYVAGYFREQPGGIGRLVPAALELFSNFDAVSENPLAMPRTLLIDSQQLESGQALDEHFRKVASSEIDLFRRDIVERTGQAQAASDLTDQQLLREVMNTVGKAGKMGGGIRCVVSVSMLTEGWDANTVTHVLGIRAFGTQLLCEQVVGRALRRQSYDLNDDGRFNVEYADIFGIPFNFTAHAVEAPVQKPRKTLLVKAMSERASLEITFPRVEGYRVELPEERLSAQFNADSVLVLNPAIVGPSVTHNAGIIGEGADMNLKHLEDKRRSELVFTITARLIETKYREAGEEAQNHLFFALKGITRQWLDSYLVCNGGTYPAQLMDQQLSDMACSRISQAITRHFVGTRPITAILDPYNPEGSSSQVRFNSSAPLRWETKANRCHINWAILDSHWEGEFCRVVESHPNVVSYVKNHNLGFEVPYQWGSQTRHYRPDFIVMVNDGHGDDDLLHLVIEIKGYRGEDAKEKKATMDTYWIPGVNALQKYGRWAFAEFTEIYEIESDFSGKVEEQFLKVLAQATNPSAGENVS